MSTTPIIYVAGALTEATRHDQERNRQDAWRMAAEVAACGAYPVTPHLSSAHLDDINDHDWWLAATLELMRRCDAVVLLPSWRRSKGTQAERLEAERLGKPVLHGAEDLAVWMRGRGL